MDPVSLTTEPVSSKVELVSLMTEPVSSIAGLAFLMTELAFRVADSELLTGEMLQQFVHSHPAEHVWDRFLHLQRLVVHPVAHLQPFTSVSTWSRILLMFSALSHCMVSSPLLICQPYSDTGSNDMLLWSACPHRWRTQHDLFQWSLSASLEAITWFSYMVRYHIVSRISLSHLWC